MSSAEQVVNNISWGINLPYGVTDEKTPVSLPFKLFNIDKGSYSNFQFKIWIALDKESNKVYMKPYEPYSTREFEDLFGFSNYCKDFNTDRLISVTRPVNYHENFEKYFD
tara:strand:+ start:427 stop:756 length:330 start_codon:yes stop_codon:yes gene_type:complete